MPTRKRGEMSPDTVKVLTSAPPDGDIRGVSHSIARALRTRNLGDILAKEGPRYPNGRQILMRTFPTVTFRLNGTGRQESARLKMAAGDVEGAEKMQVAPVPVSNK